MRGRNRAPSRGLACGVLFILAVSHASAAVQGPASAPGFPSVTRSTELTVAKHAASPFTAVQTALNSAGKWLDNNAWQGAALTLVGSLQVLGYPSTVVATLAAVVVLAKPGRLAHADLARVGPISPLPSVGNFPTWYQDKSGLTLEFCDPKNQAEVNGGYCLLLPGDVITPEVFPDNFFDEHFYYAADAIMTPVTGGRALLVLAVEAAFANGAAAAGDQMVFTRIRVRLDPVPATGTYRFIHPYGEDILEGQAGERIFFTEDVGITAGAFDQALTSRLGPFLVPSGTPGGLEGVPGTELGADNKPIDPATTPFPGPEGKLYIADPAREGPVTGSPLRDFMAYANSGAKSGPLTDHNIFRIEGPAGCNIGGPGVDFIQTTDFSLVGRLKTDMIEATVEDARAAFTGGQLHAFATAPPQMVGRLPGQNLAAVVKQQPTLSVFPGACAFSPPRFTLPYVAPAGVLPVNMIRGDDPSTPSYLGDNDVHWAKTPFAYMGAETQVCIKAAMPRNTQGQVVSVYKTLPVNDVVTIKAAVYYPGSKTLLCTATSSIPGAELTLVGFGPLNTASVDSDGSTLLTSSFDQVSAPPSKVTVTSSFKGVVQLEVTVAPHDAVESQTTLLPAKSYPLANVVAGQPGYTTIDEETTLTLYVLDDNQCGSGVVVSVSAPAGGQASTVVNADGKVEYTPNKDFYGVDSFTYTLTKGTGPTAESTEATVAVTINNVNDVPVPAIDGFTAVQNQEKVLDVLANDVDVDLDALTIVDIVELGAQFTTSPPTATAVIGTAEVDINGVTTTISVIKFKASTTGAHRFSYTVTDGKSTSVPTSVVVNVSPSMTLSVSGPAYDRGRLRFSGTVSPAAAVDLQVFYTSTTTVGGMTVQAQPVGTVSSGTNGVINFDQRSIAAPPSGPGITPGVLLRSAGVSSNSATITSIRL